ncbi:MAG: Hsp33 family molecular chaperone HslO [Muribaculaceae bacterium]|nr:Hsp33 family molecular chaperone HslO [Roseburia sp.]MCM1430110.1 Hsp33 family molecular chaperone HslO [Muribaculaceae bacterium]MCM1492175.1 Hsp33 family molecular chaperone HslO [Muribaculaceae bacterium]
MSDYIVRATAADAGIRAFAITSGGLVETARQNHNTSPIMTAALGRLLSAGAMMGSMLKGEKELVTLRIECSGPAKGLTVTADAGGKVKGFVKNPLVDLPPNAQGKLNVGGALDLGILSVIKDMGLKEPYVGQCQLQTGEIAEDLTYYFAASEQTPSAVGLGVLMNADNTVRQAGGFIIQLMPDTGDEVIEKLETRIREIDSVTMMLERGLSPEGILEEILGDFSLEITDTLETAFVCDCSKERVSRALATLSREDLDSIINDGEEIEVRCQFCNKAYTFGIAELKALK